MAYPPCNPELVPLSLANSPRAYHCLQYGNKKLQHFSKERDIVSKIQISEGTLAKRHPNRARLNSAGWLKLKYHTGQNAISRKPCAIFIPKCLGLYWRDPATILKLKKNYFSFLQSCSYINILRHIFNSARNNQQELVNFIVMKHWLLLQIPKPDKYTVVHFSVCSKCPPL